MINISQKKLYKGIIYNSSGELDAEHSINNILSENGFWCSKKSNSIQQDFFIIDYKEELPVNRIEIFTSTSGKTTFPVDFRIEFSVDGIGWRNLQTEKSFNLGDLNVYTLNIPLTLLRFIKIIITKPGKVGTKFFSEIGKVSAGIAGIAEAGASSSSSYKNDIYKLFDGNTDSYWESKAEQKKGKEDIHIDLGNIFQINRISFSSINSQEHAFPENFIIRISKDNELWTALFDERNFVAEASKKYYWDINPIECRFIHINMDNIKINKNLYILRLSEIEIFGVVIDLTHSHNIGELVSNASIFQYGLVKLAKSGEEAIGAVVQSNDSRLKDATTLNKGIIQLADDGEDKPFVAVQASDSRLKNATELKYGIVRLAKDREDNPDVVVKGNDSRLQKATETNFGIVKICSDGEYSEFGVILGNDSRIRKASSESFGIVRLANNEEVNPYCVVQANDNRLRNAATNHKGIVELAENGEDKEGVAVQGSDKRLKDATTVSKGIVELAENGEDKEGVSVQGSDKRLKDATTVSKGIVELAENGEDKEGVAVQGSDKRLKDATTVSKGIVELAENGEDKEGVAVQGSDKRLKDATTVSKGIVELAENGEDKEGVAVQGSDSRLKKASENAFGIVLLAKNREMKKHSVVQSDDDRLNDARMPLPHDHNYAPVKHEYNTHTGTIKIVDNKEEYINGIVPPSDRSAVIYAKNESGQPGAIGITGISYPQSEKVMHSYGILGHGRFAGVRGQSNGSKESEIKGAGVIGISRFGAGGVFASEHNYSLVADGYGTISGYDNTIELKGNGDALFVNGNSIFSGKLAINNKSKEKDYPSNIVEMFEVDEEQIILAGDMLVISENGKSILTRSTTKYCKQVIGIVSGNPTIILNNSFTEKKLYPVVLAGKALCRVDARERSIKAGDLIVTSDTPGCGMVGDIDSFNKIGTVIGKALDGLDKGIGIIPVFVAHQ
ncbi:MAG: discoidin domain-containing protein [Spirochaetota bacterium]